MANDIQRHFSYRIIEGELCRLSLGDSVHTQEEWQEVAAAVTTFVQKEPVANALKNANNLRFSLEERQVSHEKGNLSPAILVAAKEEYSELSSLINRLKLGGVKANLLNPTKPLTRDHLDTLLRGEWPQLEERLNKLVVIEPTISPDTFKPENFKPPQEFVGHTFYPVEIAPQQYILLHVENGKMYYFDPLGKPLQKKSAAHTIARQLHRLHFPNKKIQIETQDHTPQNIKSDSGRYLLHYMTAPREYAEMDIPHTQLMESLQADFQDINDTALQPDYARLGLAFKPENRFRYHGKSYATPEAALKDSSTGKLTDEKIKEILESKFFQDPVAQEILRSTGDLRLGDSPISLFLTDLRNNLPD